MEVIETTVVVSAATLVLIIAAVATIDHFRRLVSRNTVE